MLYLKPREANFRVFSEAQKNNFDDLYKSILSLESSKNLIIQINIFIIINGFIGFQLVEARLQSLNYIINHNFNQYDYFMISHHIFLFLGCYTFKSLEIDAEIVLLNSLKRFANHC